MFVYGLDNLISAFGLGYGFGFLTIPVICLILLCFKKR